MPETLPNPFTDPAKLPKRSLFDVKKDEKQDFIDQAMAQGLKAAQESLKKKFTDPVLQKIWDEIEERIESGEIKIHEITIGGKTKEQLIKEIGAARMTISDTAKQMMESKDFHTSEVEKDLELIELMVSDMGLPNGATTKEIYAKIKELGFVVVPAEVGPQLRLQYADQPNGGYLLVGMEPIKDSSGDLFVFDVERNGAGRFLGGNSGDPDGLWNSSSRWVFRRPPSLKAASSFAKSYGGQVGRDK